MPRPISYAVFCLKKKKKLITVLVVVLTKMEGRYAHIHRCSSTSTLTPRPACPSPVLFSRPRVSHCRYRSTISPYLSRFFFYRSAAPRYLHSFPTRRSSDLRPPPRRGRKMVFREREDGYAVLPQAGCRSEERFSRNARDRSRMPSSA